MTFQVGIVGSDGVLLASDRSHLSFAPGQGSARTSYSASKIHTEGCIAYCTSGGEYSAFAAKRIIHYLSTDRGVEQMRKALEDAGWEALQLCLKSLGQEVMEFRRHGSVLAVNISSSPVSLWHMDVAFVGREAIQIEDCKYGGDMGNAAVFFTERYRSGKTLVPIKNLRLMAAHTILMASKLNPTAVSGLEILECRADGFERVSDNEIAKLMSMSERLDTEISNALQAPSPSTQI